MSRDKPGPDDIGCVEAIEALYSYLDGEIKDSQELGAIERHLAHCRSCFSRMELERALTRHARDRGRSHAPESLQARLHKLLKGL